MVLGLSCSAERRSSGRVLLLGLDGASPRLVAEWMRAGELPNLERLARTGAWGRLRSHHPLLSPRIWTSVATGKSPEHHGIYGWVHAAGPRKGRLFQGSDRRGAALWNILSQRGLRVGVAGWVITFPPEKVNGVLVPNLALPDKRRRMEEFAVAFGFDPSLPKPADAGALAVWPAHWGQRLQALAAQDDPLHAGPDRVAACNKTPLLCRILAGPRFEDELTTRLALEIDRELRPKLLMVLLTGIDRVSHFLWAGVAAPDRYPVGRRVSPTQREQQKDALRRYYVYTDGLVGRLTERFGPSDLVLVVSDHGFEANDETGPAGRHETDAASEGVVFASGEGVRPGDSVRAMSVNDVTPTILAWLGLPLAEDMDGLPASFVERPESARVASYDDIPIERTVQSAASAEQRREGELRALGYLE